MKIIDYKLIGWADTQKLSYEIRFMINDGWQPFGGAFIDAKYPPLFYQAVVKYEEPPKP